MRFILSTLPGFTNLVLDELKIKNIQFQLLDKVGQDIYIECNNVRNLRKLQLVTRIEYELTRVEYVSNLKELRKRVRNSLKEFKDLVIESSLVNVKFFDIRKKLQKLIIREIERVFKTKMCRCRGDIEFSIRFCSSEIIFSINISTFQPLYRRWYTKFKSKASINPIIAAAMSLIAGKYDKILDPFVGSYTIPIEYYYMWKPEKITCIDINSKLLYAGLSNLYTSGVEHVINIICSDFFKIELRDKYPCIVTDPPRGLRLKTTLKFYDKMFSKFKNILDSNSVVVLPVFQKHFTKINQLIKTHGFEIERSVNTIQGGLKTIILKLRAS